MQEVVNIIKSKQEELIEKKVKESLEIADLKKQSDAKQQGLQKKIQNLLGKTRKKLKIKGQNREEKFNEKLKQLRTLNTFVNIQKTLTSMNLLDDPVIVKQINLLKEKMKQREDQEQKQQLKQTHSQVEILQLEQDDEYYDKSNFILELSTENISQQARKKRFLEGLQLMNTLRLMDLSKNRFSKSCSQKYQHEQEVEFEDQVYQNLEQEQQIRNGIDQPFNEGYDFFEKAMDGFKKHQFYHKIKQINKQKKDMTNQEQQYEELYKFLVSNGIDFGNTEFVPNENYFKNYHQKASQLIKQAEEQSKQILSEKPDQLDSNTDQKSKMKEFQLLEKNKEIFFKHRFISRKYHSPIKKSQSTQPLPPVIEEEQKQSNSAKQPIFQKSSLRKSTSILQPLKRSKSLIGVFRQIDLVNQKLKQAQTINNIDAKELKDKLKSMNEEMENAERKYSVNHLKSLQLDQESMSNYLKLTQKIRENNLFKKKGQNQLQLRKQKLFKTRFN